MQLLVE